MNSPLPMNENQSPALRFMVLGPSGPAMIWLRNQLASQPGIGLPFIGETRFFDHAFQPERREAIAREYGEKIKFLTKRCHRSVVFWKKRGILGHLKSLEGLTPHSEEWYRECFAFPPSSPLIQGEISPACTSLTENGVQAIRARFPEIRIAMMVRNPLEDVLDAIGRGFIASRDKPLSKMEWQQLGDRLDFYHHTRWSEIIPRWERIFEGRITFLPFDLIQRNPSEFLQQLHTGLQTGLRPKRPKRRPETSDADTPIPAPILQLATERTRADVEFFQQRFPNC